MSARPTVNYYEPAGAPAAEQELVSRPMTDEELAAWEDVHDEVRAETEATPEPQPALSDDELAALRELLDR